MPTVHIKDKLVFKIIGLISSGKSTYDNHQNYINDAVQEKLDREGE